MCCSLSHFKANGLVGIEHKWQNCIQIMGVPIDFNYIHVIKFEIFNCLALNYMVWFYSTCFIYLKFQIGFQVKWAVCFSSTDVNLLFIEVVFLSIIANEISFLQACWDVFAYISMCIWFSNYETFTACLWSVLHLINSYYTSHRHM